MKKYKNIIIFIILVTLLSICGVMFKQNFWISVIINIVFFGVLFFISFKDLKNDFLKFKAKSFSNLGNTFLYACVISLTIALITYLIPNNITNKNQLIIDNSLEDYFILTSILSIICAPFIEEMLFRLIPKKFIFKKYFYIFFTSFIFSLFHIVFLMTSVTDLLYIFLYFAVGLILAYEYQKHQNIFYPYLSHAFYNLLVTIMPLILNVN